MVSSWPVVRAERLDRFRQTAFLNSSSMMTSRLSHCLLLIVIPFGFAANASDEPSGDSKQASAIRPEDAKFFESKIRSLLIAHCLECHGDDPNELRGGLDLSSRQAIEAGGDSGSVTDTVDIEQSLFLRAIRYEGLEMPPKGKLPQHEIELFTEWVQRGMPDPREAERAKQSSRKIDLEAGREFWSFKQPQAYPTPNLANNDWSKTWVDDFIVHKQKTIVPELHPPSEKVARSEGRSAQTNTVVSYPHLQPNPDASREVLVRRIFLTLIGLPPTPEQIDRFVHNPSNDDHAIASLVDELLTSPHFGERWGRHWLDVARFAESSGGGRSLMFRNAWRYRDYVIESYNNDKPLPQMIREQIAGDLLPWESPKQLSDQLVATGYLVLGPTNYEQQDKETLRLDVIDEQIDTIGRAFLGMSLGCARCHDHKFDPIPATDYYALAGIFSSTQTLTPGNVSGVVMETLPPNEMEAIAEARYRQQLADLEEQYTKLSGELKSLGYGELANEIVKPAASKSIDVAKLTGIVIDDSQAKFVGEWTESTSVGTFVQDRYMHDANTDKGKKKATFATTIIEGGAYDIRVAYTASSNRATRVPVVVEHASGSETVFVNQQVSPDVDGIFQSLGQFSFDAGSEAIVTIDTAGTIGVVIADAVQLIPHNDRVATQSKKAENNSQEVITKHTDCAADQHVKELADQVARSKRELADLRKNSPDQFRFAMTVNDVEKPDDCHLLIRGEARNFGPKVPRGFLTVTLPKNAESLSFGESESGRLQLANWIASESNPLTARVYVNRIWQHVFGRGIVETPDNHGATGALPTHPELLDRLAVEFMKHGWSTKQLIRLLMSSRVFRMTTDGSAESLKLDEANAYLWRANRRPLDAEVLRDSLLAVCGNLELTAGGNTIEKFSQYDWDYDFTGFNRRSVYVPQFRNAMLELLEVFDAANPNLVTGKRPPSTLPSQSLYLMNHPFVIEQSRILANRLQESSPESDVAAVEQLYRWTLGRLPTSEERQIAIEYLDDVTLSQTSSSVDRWSSLCHMLLACVDFRYLQ